MPNDQLAGHHRELAGMLDPEGEGDACQGIERRVVSAEGAKAPEET
jgi:hypothetical protein